LIPDFEPVTVTSTTVNTDTTALFTNYNQGLVNNYTGDTYVDMASEGYYLDDCVTIDSYVIEDPDPTAEVNDCGCDIEDNDDSIQIDLSFSATSVDCPMLYEGAYSPGTTYSLVAGGYYVFQYPLFETDGVTAAVPPFYNSPFINPECCSATTFDGMPVEYVDMNIYSLDGIPNTDLTALEVVETYSDYLQTGSICCETDGNDDYVDDCVCFATCNWRLTGSTFESNTVIIDGETYLRFVNPLGEYRVGSPDGCNCAEPSTKVPVTDPYTGIEGVGCKITNTDWYTGGGGNIITLTYEGRFSGDEDCTWVWSLGILVGPH